MLASCDHRSDRRCREGRIDAVVGTFVGAFGGAVLASGLVRNRVRRNAAVALDALGAGGSVEKRVGDTETLWNGSDGVERGCCSYLGSPGRSHLRKIRRKNTAGGG